MKKRAISKVYESSDYGAFMPHKLNRGVRPRKDLVESMEAKGWMDGFPAIIVPDNGTYVVLDGHNRIMAAEKAGVPVKFIIVNDTKTTPNGIIPPKRWTPGEVMKAYAQSGNREYGYLERYLKNYPMPVTSAIMLLSNALLCDGGASGSAVKKFNAGEFKVSSFAHAERVGQLVTYCSKFLKFGKRQSWISALSRVCRLEQFDDDRFIKKIASHYHLIEERPRYREFIYEIEKVYNYHVSPRNKVALAVHTEA